MTEAAAEIEEAVGEYLHLGLAIGRHIEGFVDAYYGPPSFAAAAAAGPPRAAVELAGQARRLLGELDGDSSLPPARRRWLRGQVLGLYTSARKLAGEVISYADEVESCYGVRPRRVDEEVFAGAHRLLAEALPGDGVLADRLVAWRESHAVPVEVLPGLLESLSEDLRARTAAMFGLPDGEGLDFELVTNEPWSGFNYYLGGLRSRVAINVDLPVLSLSLGHLVAHEAYPGHHTEHCLKEAGLVRSRRQTEETIFCVGTPQCLLAEGLADLGVEVILGTEHESVLAGHVRAHGLKLDPDVMAAVSTASRDLLGVRGNVGLLLHTEGRSPDEAAAYLARWGLQSLTRATKAVGFFLDPTWRAYTTCYVEGLPLCRSFVAADPQRFRRLLTEQLLPADLVAAAP